jgi:hypothetical protein
MGAFRPGCSACIGARAIREVRGPQSVRRLVSFHNKIEGNLEMFVPMHRTFLSIAMLVFWLPGGGCTSHGTLQPHNTVTKEALSEGGSQDPRQASRPVTDAVAVSARLHAIATEGKLADLRWPDFTDYQPHFKQVYDTVNFAPVWVRGGQPSPQALGVIQALENSRQKGLNPDVYDASRWPPYQ